METAAVALPLSLEPDEEVTIAGAVMLRDRGARAVAEALRLSSTRTHTVTLLCGVKVVWQANR
jgi:flagellar biosynthesis regulator FlbT